MRWLRLLRTLPLWRQAVYWLASITALALVIWDIVDQGAQYTSIVVVVLVMIARSRCGHRTGAAGKATSDRAEVLAGLSGVGPRVLAARPHRLGR